MKISMHCALFLAVLAPTGLVRVAFNEHYRDDLRLAAGNATRHQAEEIERRWKRLVYRDLHETRTKELLIEKLQSTCSSLTDQQAELLKVRVWETLTYLAHPDLDGYLKLRMQHVPCRLIPQGRAKRALDELAKKGVAVPASVDGNERELVKLLWQSVVGQNAEAPSISGVCLDSISSAITTNNSGWLLLRGPVKKGFTVAVEALNPGFVYEDPGLYLTNGQFFEFSCLARSGFGGVGPLHVSLQWIGQRNDWAINRLLGDAWLKFDTLF